MSNNHETLKSTMDIVSVFAAIGSFLQMLTPVFGLIGAVWTLMRIAEMISGKPFADLIRRKKADAEQK
jgi:hypothetical protein